MENPLSKLLTSIRFGGTKMIWYKVATICLISVVCASADTFTFQGPFGPTDGSVVGPVAEFALQDVSLTTPSAPAGEWTVTIHTNYGAPLPGPPGDVIPDWGSYAAADFLISWNGGFYGIVLHSHDGYTAGDLYQANGFQTAGQVRQDPSSDPVENRDVWLDAGGSWWERGRFRQHLTEMASRRRRIRLPTSSTLSTGFCRAVTL